MTHEPGTHLGLLLGEVMTQSVHLPPVEAPCAAHCPGLRTRLWTQHRVQATKSVDWLRGWRATRLAPGECVVKRTAATLRIRQRRPWGDDGAIPHY